MEFTEDFIKQNALTDTQVSNLTAAYIEHEAELKKEWDGKANTLAEGILSGASAKVMELTGVERSKGQKVADYIAFASNEYVTKSLSQKQKELEEKIKGGDNALKIEYEQAKAKLEMLQKKEADFDKLIDGGFETKYSELLQKMTNTQDSNALLSVKPNFPESVNKYEALAKWNEFELGIKKMYYLEFDEHGVALAIDKENKHKVYKLSELVSKDDNIQSLSKGRQQTGLGAKKTISDVEGIPFKVDLNESRSEQQKRIKEYLITEEKLDIISTEYSKRFAELNYKLRQKTAK